MAQSGPLRIYVHPPVTSIGLHTADRDSIVELYRSRLGGSLWNKCITGPGPYALNVCDQVANGEADAAIHWTITPAGCCGVRAVVHLVRLDDQRVLWTNTFYADSRFVQSVSQHLADEIASSVVRSLLAKRHTTSNPHQ